MDLVAIENALLAWIIGGTGLDDQHVIIPDGKPRPVGTYVQVMIADALPKDNDWLRREDRYLVLPTTVASAVDFAAGAFTMAAHPFRTGDGALRLLTTGTAPGGAAVLRDYWAIKLDANRVQLADTFLNAMRAQPITLTDAGAGTHSLAVTATTTRQGEEIDHIAEGVRRITVDVQCFSQIANGQSAARAPLLRLVDSMRLPSQSAALRAGHLGLSDWTPVQTIDGVQNTTRFEARATMSFVFYTVSSIREPGTYAERATIRDVTRGRTFTVSSK